MQNGAYKPNVIRKKRKRIVHTGRFCKKKELFCESELNISILLCHTVTCLRPHDQRSQSVICLFNELRTRSTFCRLLCFWKMFSECQVCAHDKREMFYSIFYFLLCCYLNPPIPNAGTYGGALTLPSTHERFRAYTGARTRH